MGVILRDLQNQINSVDQLKSPSEVFRLPRSRQVNVTTAYKSQGVDRLAATEMPSTSGVALEARVRAYR